MKHIELPQVVKDLSKLYEVLSPPNAWCQHKLQDSTGARCLVGGMMLVHGDIREVFEAVANRIGKHEGYGASGQVAEWNDREGRTHAEVLQLIRDAIAYEMDKL